MTVVEAHEWMAQDVLTVQASLLGTVSSGSAEGKGHLCVPTLGSSRLKIFSEALGVDGAVNLHCWFLAALCLKASSFPSAQLQSMSK